MGWWERCCFTRAWPGLRNRPLHRDPKEQCPRQRDSVSKGLESGVGSVSSGDTRSQQAWNRVGEGKGNW